MSQQYDNFQALQQHYWMAVECQRPEAMSAVDDALRAARSPVDGGGVMSILIRFRRSADYLPEDHMTIDDTARWCTEHHQEHLSATMWHMVDVGERVRRCHCQTPHSMTHKVRLLCAYLCGLTVPTDFADCMRKHGIESMPESAKVVYDPEMDEVYDLSK